MQVGWTGVMVDEVSFVGLILVCLRVHEERGVRVEMGRVGTGVVYVCPGLCHDTRSLGTFRDLTWYKIFI